MNNIPVLQSIALMALRQHECTRYHGEAEGVSGICLLCRLLDRLYTPDTIRRTIFDQDARGKGKGDFAPCNIVYCDCQREQKDIGLGALYQIGWRWNPHNVVAWSCPVCTGHFDPNARSDDA